MNRNRMTICGRKTMTLPTPEIRPSLRKLRMISGSGSAAACTPSQVKPSEIRFITGWAQANTAWNITNRMASRMISPPTGCSTSLSTLAVPGSSVPALRIAARSTRSASRWALRNAAASGARQSAVPRQAAAGRHRDRGHHRDAELARQHGKVDVDATLLGDVHHVEGHQDGAADLLEL